MSNKQAVYMLGGFAAIFIGWIFATLTPDSPIAMWYGMFSFIFSAGGLVIVILALTNEI